MSEIKEEIQKEEKVSSVESNNKKKNIKIALIVILVALLTAGAVFFLRGEGSLPFMDSMVANMESKKVVALVNGEKITQGDIDEIIARMLPSQNGGIDDATKMQIIEDVVNMRLLLQEAKKEGLSVSDEEVKSEIDALIVQVGGEDAFMEQVESIGFTRSKLEESFKEELLIQKYIDSRNEEGPVVVSEEEIQNAYNEAVAFSQSAGENGSEMQAIPPFSEVRDEIEAQLIQQKQLEIISEYVETLRESADIEIKI
jgi:peptidyl-prolyl cis-trans isomerase SurA